jgi:hypothetical protein
VGLMWQRYLASKGGQYAARAGMPSPDWNAAEQDRWPVYDLAGFYLPDGAVPEHVVIERAGEEYRVTTRFRPPGPAHDSAPPAITVNVYAVRIGDRWRLANALPRLTRGWRRDTVGPITYVYPPDYPYDRARARRAVAFVDSVAAAFDVPRLTDLTYYLTRSVDEVYRIMGLDWGVRYGPVGGAAQPINRQLFSGIPSVGEEYRHELAHLVLVPLVGARTPYLVSEGVATWLGGTMGMDLRTAAARLAACLRERPAVTLDSLLAPGFPEPLRYTAGAVLTAMVFDQTGVAGVKTLFDAGPTTAKLRATFERQLGRPWPAIVPEWRGRVLAFAGEPDRGTIAALPPAACAPHPPGTD